MPSTKIQSLNELGHQPSAKLDRACKKQNICNKLSLFVEDQTRKDLNAIDEEYTTLVIMDVYN